MRPDYIERGLKKAAHSAVVNQDMGEYAARVARYMQTQGGHDPERVVSYQHAAGFKYELARKQVDWIQENLR